MNKNDEPGQQERINTNVKNAVEETIGCEDPKISCPNKGISSLGIFSPSSSTYLRRSGRTDPKEGQYNAPINLVSLDDHGPLTSSEREKYARNIEDTFSIKLTPEQINELKINKVPSSSKGGKRRRTIKKRKSKRRRTRRKH